MNWPIRNQRHRGTCVAFVFAACRELLAAESEGLSDPPDLSEQFFYWAIKEHDGIAQEGTTFEHACDAMSNYGISDCKHWPYSDHPAPAGHDVRTHAGLGNPPAIALSDADPRRLRPRYNDRPTAKGVKRALRKTNRSVGVTVRVFVDPSLSPAQMHSNWETTEAIYWGIVRDPDPGTHVRHCVHAICIIAAVPDTDAPGGGWFYFRNSWGEDWATHAADDGVRPGAGYGMISFAYIDNHACEMAYMP
jgi:hypothetical protein